jgi:hypothetical protein
MNQISAMLSRARIEAVGLQEPRGVFFYVDPATQREMMALVKVTDANPASDAHDVITDPSTGVTSFINYSYLDLSAADHVPLPKGVGLQVMTDQTVPTEKYLGYNTFGSAGSSTIPVGGVILFDGYGRLTTPKYGFRMKAIGTTSTQTDMGKLVNPLQTSSSGTPMNDFVQRIPSTSNNAPRAAFGFVVFDKNVADDTMGGNIDPDQQPNETGEENWLDQNGTPVMVNRYNGTLLKGQ